MQDQLIIWMALARGASSMLITEPTLHTRTAMVVAEALLPGARFTITPADPTMQPRAAPQGGAGSGGGGGGCGDGSNSRGGGGYSGAGAGPGTRQQLFLVECQGAGVTAPGPA